MRTMEVTVPLAEDYQIDDFLANTLQYKIDENWIYLTSLKLPPNDLKISVTTSYTIIWLIICPHST